MTKMNVPAISIIIPTKDRAAILHKTLAAVIKATKNIAAEIIIVNDSKTEEVILKQFDSTKIRIFNNSKSGVASARNLGAMAAMSDLLLFMDDDMMITEKSILDTLDLHYKLPNACINVNWIYPEDLMHKIQKTQFGRYLIHYKFTSLKGWYNHSSWNDIAVFESYGITSQFLFIAKNIFNKTGGYDETFPHAGAEDNDFGNRLAKEGVKFYINPLSIVFHNEEDRVEIKQWLERKKRGGETRKVAVNKGHADLEIKTNIFKSYIYRLIIPIKELFFILMKYIPNYKTFDSLYFRLANILLGTYYFEGYNKIKK